MQFLKHCSPEQRYVLVSKTSPPLARYLGDLIKDAGGLPVHHRFRSPTFPDDLETGFRDSLERYQAKLERMRDARLKNGYSPSAQYVSRPMQAPIHFAQFLQKEGRTSFDGVLKRDIVAFLQSRPTLEPTQVLRFTRFLDEHRPWRDKRGGGVGRKARAPHSLVPPEVFSPDELTAFMADVERETDPAGYLLAWLVGGLGLSLTNASRLTLDRVAVDGKGRLVIRPAQIWLTLPRSIEGRLKNLLDAHNPGWQTLKADVLAHRKVFAMNADQLRFFGRDILKRQARKLRTSALLASMMRGNIDRVTLHTTTGASFQYLCKIETLLSVDMHRRLAPDLVKARNEFILGERDE